MSGNKLLEWIKQRHGDSDIEEASSAIIAVSHTYPTLDGIYRDVASKLEGNQSAYEVSLDLIPEFTYVLDQTRSVEVECNRAKVRRLLYNDPEKGPGKDFWIFSSFMWKNLPVCSLYVTDGDGFFSSVTLRAAEEGHDFDDISKAHIAKEPFAPAVRAVSSTAPSMLSSIQAFTANSDDRIYDDIYEAVVQRGGQEAFEQAASSIDAGWAAGITRRRGSVGGGGTPAEVYKNIVKSFCSTRCKMQKLNDPQLEAHKGEQALRPAVATRSRKEQTNANSRFNL